MLTTIFSLAVLAAGVYSDPLVRTPLGLVQGFTKTSFNGRAFSAFEGIPYAQPPVGSLRFEEPREVLPWQGTWQANQRTQCAQNVMTMLNETTGSEDCLYINVYVPRDTIDPNERLDVIVHIHGGAFSYGNSYDMCGPEYFMDHDVIVVTFNYRLGVFGFLSTEDHVVPGNNGLKDQVMALKWVQHNILSFGGNPGSVTLTGLSAGASSTHLHYFSELSKGLFHRGFSQSGSALNPFSVMERPLINTKKLADALGCPTDNTRNLVDCLKERPSQNVLSKVPLLFSYLMLPAVVFGPVLEKGGVSPFMTVDPYVSLAKGEVTDVPWIASNTKDEGMFPVIYLIETLDYVDQNWDDLAPSMLAYNNTLDPSLWVSTAETIKQFYLGDEPISLETLMQFVPIFSDRFYLDNSESAVKLQSNANKSPVYYYNFRYPGDNNPLGIVPHAGDIMYYFTSSILPDPLTPNEIIMKDLLVDMLVNYARTGVPVVEGIQWDPTQADQLTYLKIDGVEPGEISQQVVDEFTNRAFWDSLGFEEGANLLQ